MWQSSVPDPEESRQQSQQPGEGAKVVLIEEDMAPGGAPVDMFVPFVCGAPRLGVFSEMINRLNEKHDLSGKPGSEFQQQLTMGKQLVASHPFQQVALLSLIAAEPNLTLMCGCPVIEAIIERSRRKIEVKGVRMLRNGYLQEVRAKVTIDATGTGLVAASAGCEFMYGNESMEDFGESVGMAVGDGKVQPCTWMFRSKDPPGCQIPVGSTQREQRHGGRRAGLAAERESGGDPQTDKGAYLFWGTTVPVKIHAIRSKLQPGNSGASETGTQHPGDQRSRILGHAGTQDGESGRLGVSRETMC